MSAKSPSAKSPKSPFYNVASVRKTNALLAAGLTPPLWPKGVRRPTHEDTARSGQRAMQRALGKD